MTSKIVDIVAPASGSTPDEMYAASAFLKAHGFTPRIPEVLFRNKEYYHAQTDALRFEHFKDALLAPDSDILWCLRGGYGCARLVPMLETLTPAREKTLIGFSDITVLHLFARQRWGWKTLHAPVLYQLGLNRIAQHSVDTLFGLLAHTVDQCQFELTPVNDAAKRSGSLTAPVTGGNLSIVQTSLATAWEIDSKDAIVFLEEIGEKGYRIDRMLNHLLQAGIFAHAKAVLLGDCLESMDASEEDAGVVYALQRFADMVDIPVLRLPHIGHGTRNDPLPFGTSSTLTLGERPTLISRWS